MQFNPEDYIGMVLNKRYKLVKVIGQGGMGVVFRAQEFNSSQPVAIKVLMPKKPVNSDSYNKLLRRFKREIKIISRFQHPNIMPIYNYGEQNGLVYLVMPYVKGGTLDKLLQEGPLSSYQALIYIEQAASALDYAHDHRVIHRDIKPSNFLLDENGQLLLADFGVAHVTGETFTQEGEFIGTRIYAPGEALFDGHIDGRADIYSLGAVLCEMLTGVTPSETPITCSTIPSTVDAIIRKATAQNAQDRYATAGALAAAFRRAIEIEHNAPTEVSLPYRFTPDQNPVPAPVPINSTSRGRKRPIVMIVSILLIVIVIVSAGTFTALFLLKMSVPQTALGLTTTPVAEQQAQKVVLQYYDFWNKGNYKAAYNLLSRSYQAKYSYAELLTYYRSTRRSCPTINSTKIYSNSSVLVTITDVAVENNPSTLKTVINVYKLDYTVTLEAGLWRLTPKVYRIDVPGTC